MSKPSSHATTLFDHVRELQFRLLASVAVLLVGGVVGYFLYNPIFQLLRSPLHTHLYYSSPAGSFLFVMKISLVVAIGVALPVIIYNLIMFIRPAFKERLSRTRVYMTTVGSVFLAALGAVFAFVVILPASIKFFVGFQVTGLSALIDASTYLTFVTNTLISFILVFQLPLLIGFIDHIKPIPPKKLLKMEKWVIIAAALIGVLAPFSFDPITELLIAAPIIVLFNLSILMIVIQHAYKRRVEKKVLKKEAKVIRKTERQKPSVVIAHAKNTPKGTPQHAPLLPQAHALVKQPTSVLENSFLDTIIKEEPTTTPVATPTVTVKPVASELHKPAMKKRWMDVGPTPTSVNASLHRPATLAPARPRPQTPHVTIPQRPAGYSRPKFISDML